MFYPSRTQIARALVGVIAILSSNGAWASPPSCAIFFKAPWEEDPSAQAQQEAVALKRGQSLARYVDAHGLLSCIDPAQAAQLLAYYEGETADAARYRDIDRDIDLAKEHWFNFEFDEALALITHALEDMPGTASDQKVHALLVKALILKAQGKKAELDTCFKEALVTNPNLEISALDFPPSYRARFDAVKKQITQGPHGDIEVTSLPPAADVFVNGIKSGVTPLVVRDLPVGTYTVEVRANRYLPQSAPIDIKDGDTQALHLNLSFKRGQALSTGHLHPLLLGGDTEIGTAPSPSEAAPLAVLALMKEAIAKAKLLHVDTAIVLSEKKGSPDTPSQLELRVLDVALAASHRPLAAPLDTLEKHGSPAWQALEPNLSRVIREPLLANPQKTLDLRTGELVVMNHVKKPLYRRAEFWVGLGLAVVGGTVGGVLAAQGSGQGSTSSGGQGGVGVGLGGF